MPYEFFFIAYWSRFAFVFVPAAYRFEDLQYQIPPMIASARRISAAHRPPVRDDAR